MRQSDEQGADGSVHLCREYEPESKVHSLNARIQICAVFLGADVKSPLELIVSDATYRLLQSYQLHIDRQANSGAPTRQAEESMVTGLFEIGPGQQQLSKT